MKIKEKTISKRKIVMKIGIIGKVCKRGEDVCVYFQSSPPKKCNEMILFMLFLCFAVVDDDEN